MVKRRKPDGWPVLVQALRDASTGIEEAASQTGDETVFFPAKEAMDRQPVRLMGDVRLSDVAGLVHYIADMLEK